MPNDVIITPSTGRVQFVKDTGQALLRYNIDLSAASGLIIDSPLTSSVGIKSPNLADLSGNNTFAGATTFNGATTINGNLSVYGATNIFSASNIYITSSVLTVTDNILTLNALSPYQRYAGIEMYDTGSGTLSSILWDGTNDYFFLTGSGVNGKLITGPDGQTNLTSNYIPKATAGFKLGNSLVYDDGTYVGINTTAPSSSLTVQSNATQLRLQASSAPGSFFANVGARYDSTRPFTIEVANNNSTAAEFFGIYADSGGSNNRVSFPTGNVGIGLTNPSAKFHVTSSTNADEVLIGTIGNDQIVGGRTGGSFGISTKSTSNGNLILTSGDAFYIRTSGSNDRVIVKNDGNVGIGTTSPSTKLNVVGNADIGDSTADTGIIVRHGAGSAQYGRIRFYDSNGLNVNTIHSFPVAWQGGTLLNSSAGAINITGWNGVTFGSWNNVDVAFSSNGINYFKNLVGIGTTLPSASLHIKSSTSGATLLRTDGTNGTLFSVVDDLSDSLMSVNNSAGLPVLEVFADDRIVAGQYGQNDLVVINNKVGIGTNNPANKLYVSGSVSIGSGTYNISAPTNGLIVEGKVGVGTNSVDSWAQLKVIGTSALGGIVYVTDKIQALSAFPGSATNLQLNTDGGNVGIGTTLPFAKLHVQGNISASSFTSSISNAVGFLGTSSWANNATTVVTNANLTGDVTSVGNATTIANNAVTTVKILDANVTNAKLTNSSLTIGSTAIALGATATTIAGLTSVTSTTFVGALTGTATTASYANNLNAANQYTVGGITASLFGTSSWATNALTANNVNNATLTVAAGTGISLSATPTFTANASVDKTITVTNSSPNATHTGDVTGATALTIANDAITTVKILDANVTNAKLANSSLTIGSTAISLGGTATTIAGLSSLNTTNLTASNISASATGSFGMVGIGTSTAGCSLDVLGSGTVRFGQSGSTYSANILFGNDQATWGSGIRVYDNNDAELRIYHRNTRGQIVLATGYNGNGATSMPTDGLFIVGDTTASPALKVGIGYTAADIRGGSAKLYVNGNISAAGNISEGGYISYGMRVYTVNLAAQSTASFYPIVIDNAPDNSAWHHSFSIEMPSLGGGSPYNMHSMYGEVRGQGWTDQTAFYRVFHNYYDNAERSILGVWRPTQSWYGVVVYVRGGMTYYVRTNSRTVVGYAGPVNPGGNAVFAVKNAAGVDVSGSSAFIGEMLNLINNPSGFYHSNGGYFDSIGIGTTNAIARLDVRGSHPSGYGIVNVISTDSSILCLDSTGTRDQAIRLKYNGTDKWLVGMRDTNEAFSYENSGGSRVLTILQNGNVGFGPTSPSVRLHVSGSSILSNNTGIDPDAYTNTVIAGAISDRAGWGLSSAIGGNAGTGHSWAIGSNGAYLYMAYGNGTGNDSLSEFLMVTGSRQVGLVPVSGNVGVGTINPFAKLNVVRAGVNEGAISFEDESCNAHLLLQGSDARVRLQLGTYNNGNFGGWIQASYDNSPNSSSNSGAEPLILNPQGGNVGIGTTGPVATLNVKTSTIANREVFMGDSATVSGVFRARLDDNSLSFISLENRDTTATTNHGVGIRFNLGTSVSNNAINAGGIYLGKEQQWTATAATQDSYLMFNTSLDGTANEKVRITSDGNVGIGTTSPLGKLDVRGNITSSGQIRSDVGFYSGGAAGTCYFETINIGTGVYIEGGANEGIYFGDSNRWIIDTCNAAHNDNADGELHFRDYTNSITRMLIQYSTGNIGMGITTPSASLHVKSTTSGATLLRTDGTNGTLFSVVDDLSDSLMSVNNSAGLPVLEVFADDRIVAGQYGQNDFVVRNNYVGIGTNNPTAKLYVTSSTSTPSALFLGGNVGIGSSSPSAKLVVNGEMQVQSSNAYFTHFNHQDAGNNFITTANGGATYFRGSSNNVTTMTVGGGGNVTLQRDLIVNGGTGNPYGNRILIQTTAATYTLQDSNLRPTIYLNGDYPVLTLNHTATSNANHGPTIQFAFNGLTTGGSTSRQIVIGANGVGGWLDFGFSGGGYGDNTNYNPHNGISGYSGITAMRLFSNGLLVGGTGTYPNHITSISNQLDVRGTGYFSGAVTASVFTGAGTGLTGTAASLTAGTATNATQFGGESNTNFMRGLSSASSSSLDTLTANGFRIISYTGHSKGLLTFSVGGSIGTVQHEYFYNTPANGWRVRNYTDSNTWSAWGNVVMTDTNQGLLTGTVLTTNYSGTVSGLNIGGNAATVTTNANLSGDVTSTGNSTTIANNAVTTVKISNSNVTYAKIQNVSNSTVLGRITAGAGVVEELTGANIATIIGSNAVTNATNATTATTANALNASNQYSVTGITGSIQTTAVRETFSAISSATTGAIDLSTATVFNLAFSSSISVFSISNVNTSKVNSFTLISAGSGTAATITWNFITNGGASTAVKWAGTAPTATTTSGRFDVFSFVYDGTRWFGFTGGLNYN